jgi:hypothetical protein
LAALQSPSEESSNSSDDLVVLLRFLDCLAWESSTPLEEARHFSPAADYVKVLIKIADQSQDLHIIKLLASFLGTARSWPGVAEPHTRLLAKFVTLAEASEKIVRNGLLSSGNAGNLMEKYQKALTWRLDFEPDKNKTKKKDEARVADQQPNGQVAAADLDSDVEQEQDPDQGELGDDILADIANIRVTSTSASGDSGSGEIPSQANASPAVQQTPA